MKYLSAILYSCQHSRQRDVQVLPAHKITPAQTTDDIKVEIILLNDASYHWLHFRRMYKDMVFQYINDTLSRLFKRE